MKETLTLNVQKALRQELLKNRVSPGERIPTEAELAVTHQVSLTTIRRAVDGLVSDGLLVRRQGSGTYVADRRQARQQTIGLVIPEAKFSPFYMQMATRLEPILRERGYTTTLLVAEDLEGFHQAIRGARKKMDGLIICGYLIRYEELQAEGIPYVIAGTEKFVDADCVVFDLKSGVVKAMEHLITLGHRDILFLSNHSAPGLGLLKMDQEATLSRDNRFAGYEQALAKAGLQLRMDLVLQGGPSRRTAYETIKKRLQENPLNFTAIFAGTDVIAEGAAQALMEAGYKIPRDISLIGCDNINDGADSILPLTTIDLRIEDAVRRAVDLLLARVEQPLSYEYHSISLVPSLVLRSTTAGPSVPL